MNRVQTSLLLTALFLSLAPNAQASSTWYVNGVSGSDSNACISPTSACKTIGHAASLAASGDSIVIAAGLYQEHLTIAVNLNLIGSSQNTIIDGLGTDRVVNISVATATVATCAFEPDRERQANCLCLIPTANQVNVLRRNRNFPMKEFA